MYDIRRKEKIVVFSYQSLHCSIITAREKKKEEKGEEREGEILVSLESSVGTQE